jgi:hypothetical protein
MRLIARLQLVEIETMRPQLPLKTSPTRGRMRMIKMRRLPEKSLAPMFLFERAFRDADVGLGGDLTFFQGMHGLSIPPYNRDMTDEERYERLDRRIEAIAMNLELTVSMAQASEARMGKRLDQLLKNSEQDGENIRALARIAEMHEHRLSDLEGGGRKN